MNPSALPHISPTIVSLMIAATLLLFAATLVMASYRKRQVLRVWEVRRLDLALWIWLVVMVTQGAGGVLVALVKKLLPAEADLHLWSVVTAAWASPTIPLLIIGGAIAYHQPLRSALGPWPSTPRLGLKDLALHLAAFARNTIGIYLPIAMLWGLMIAYASKHGLCSPKEQMIVEIIKSHPGLLPTVLLIIPAVLLAPIAEETLFRAMLYRGLRQWQNPTIAALISGLIFALLHFNLRAFVPLWVLGFFLAKAYEESADLRVPILGHACFNGLMIVFMIALYQ